MPVEPPTTNPGPTVLAVLPNPSRQIGGPASLKEQPIGFRSISGLSTYLDPTGQHEGQFFSDILEITHTANLTTQRIIRPTATTSNAWAITGAATAHEAVDEATADDDTSYVAETTVDDSCVLAFPAIDFALPTGHAISKVVLTFRARKTATGASQSISGGAYDGTGYEITVHTFPDDTDYHKFETTMLVDPSTSAVWTEAGVNGMDFYFAKKDANANAIRVTQAFITVHYYITPSGTRGSTGYGKGFDWGALYSKRSAGLDADTAAVNNSETLVNISELFATVGANRSCAFTAWLFYDAATAADIKFTVAVPADAVVYLAGIGPSTAIAAAIGDAAFRYSAATGTPAAIAFGGAGVGTIVCALLFGRASFVTQGELQLQFAQNTANVSDAKVRAASYLDVEIH